MEHKHTPGPWTNHGRIPQPGLPHSCIAAKTLIARVYSETFGDAEQEAANARLIAAAPELLDALLIAEAFMAGFEDDDSQEGIQDNLRQIRAALAKTAST